MSKKFVTLLGAGLILLGVMGLVSTLLMPMVGVRVVRWSLQRIWPAIIVNIGLALTVIPLISRRRRGLGGMFIAGLPILATGAILFAASMTGWWGMWSWLWPMEVLSVAAGFLAAALYMKVIWLIIPAFIVGANGLLMQFCAITGLWDAWAVMWTIEPLSVGLALLLIGARKQRKALMLVGLGLCGAAGLAAMGMMAVVPLSSLGASWWLMRLAGPVLFLVVGGLLLLWGLTQRSTEAEAPEADAAETPQAGFVGTTPELNLR